MPILLTTKGVLEQVRRLLAMNVGIKGTTGVIAQSERTKTMKTKLEELSDQLQELSDKGFIRPGSSPWGAPVLLPEVAALFGGVLQLVRQLGYFAREWLEHQEARKVSFKIRTHQEEGKQLKDTSLKAMLAIVVVGFDGIQGKPQHDDKGFVDSGCSRYMTGNIAYLSYFKEFDRGYVAFGGVADENQILLKIHRKDNMYSLILKNIVPKESLTCLVVKATLDESMLWHRRLGHINFKNINKLVKDNLGSNTELLEKGIKREYSVARTPQQNGVAERRNRNTH
ncbi:putative ribonuclease H-like domain-containing protein [Tanacetum coccineum]